MRSLIAALAFVGTSVAFAGDDAQLCNVSAAATSSCWVAVSQLQPTQLTYGAIEVQRRSADIGQLSGDDLTKYLEKHFVTMIIGPGGFYITDGHHVALAYAAVAGANAAVYAQVQANWSNLTTDAFWNAMQASGLVHLYDENGQGPLPLTTLPASLFSLRDDPFRSLAWGVRKQGAYDDSTVPYADFLWADFFRLRIGINDVETNFDVAVEAAVPYAESSAASGLPGYTGGN